MSSTDDTPRGSISFQGALSFGHTARAKPERQIEGLDVADEAGVSSDALWSAARRFAAGVTVVTATSDEGYLGITVSAYSLVSLAPPLVLVCINEFSQLLEAIQTSGAFAATILSSRQELLAERFAGRAPRPASDFGDILHRTLLTGAPVLEGGLAWLDCQLQQAIS
ncbi:MAG TPA: flavin reductase family protein, partial [Roseiflexaceae bacterium]|nr:flavin reductase family protein [Roseiflexaceae bacterium]